MIFDVRDEAQQQTLSAEMHRHMLLYRNVFLFRCGRGLVLLIKPWSSRTAVR